MSKNDSLLVEIRTEELPPAQLWELADSFPDALLVALQKAGFADDNSLRAQSEDGKRKLLATPRRLVALLSNIQAEVPPQEIVRRGPQMSACKDADGTPTKALIGFMQSVGVTCEKDLTTITEKEKEYIAWRGKSPARKLADELAAIVERVLLSLPAPRLMRWGANEFKFIRPIRGVLMLHGKTHISGNVMGISATQTTKGHPFMSEGDVAIADVDSYVDVLKEHKVIVDMDERLEFIAGKIEEASNLQGKFEYNKDSLAFEILVLGSQPDLMNHLPISFEGDEQDFFKNIEEKKYPFNSYAVVPRINYLLREVCAICEFPTVHQKIVDERFKELPWKCMKECMQKHQRFFPMIWMKCKINLPILFVWTFSQENVVAHEMSLIYFIVSDNVPEDSEHQDNMLRNYDSVLSARLSDVSFYYEEDKKIALGTYVENLKDIVFHKKLGSQYDRIERACKIAYSIHNGYNSVEEWRPAAEMFLASLPTQMVGEYPTLQEEMSWEYFFKNSNRIAADIPNMRTFYALEKLIGMFGAGEVPTGSKDPHGLRRDAQHVALEYAIDKGIGSVKEAIGAAVNSYDGKIKNVTDEVYDFVLGRFEVLLLSKHNALHPTSFCAPITQKAILSQKPNYFYDACLRIQALNGFYTDPKCEILATANKRINNIFRKSNINPTDLYLTNFDSSLASEEAEKELDKKLSQVEFNIAQNPHLPPNFPQILQETANLAPAVDNFFDNVLVNADKGKIRQNRFALLARLHKLLNTVGDLSYLAK